MDEAENDLSVCRSCQEPLTNNARVCVQCGASQTLWGRINQAMKWIGAAATIVSLLIGATSLWGLYQASLETRATISELAAAADMLRDRGDYHRAWQLYDEASALDATAPRVRRGREDLAMTWIPRLSVPDGEKFSDRMSQILPVLIRGHQQSDGNRATDFLALSGWAYYLERRDHPFSNVDIPAIYHEALNLDPGNVFANLFLGHWLASEELDLEASKPFFNAAMNSSRERRLVRQFHAAALQNLLQVSRSDPDHQSAVHFAMLHLLQDMHLVGENFEDTFRDQQRTLFTALRAYSELPFEVLMEAFDPAAHHVLINTLLAAVDPSASENRAVLQTTLFQGFLYEQTGDREAALTRYQSLHTLVARGSQLRPRLDEALERVSGKKTKHH